MMTANRSTTRDLELSQTLVVDECAGNDVGQQPGLGDDQQGGQDTDGHGHHQIAPSGPGIVEKPWVEEW